jgi:hypothetical protein
MDVAALVRRYEPVIRYTAGELFFPMDVADYVGQAALWTRRPGSDRRDCAVGHGSLDLAQLCALSTQAEPGTEFELRYVADPLTRTELRKWRRHPDRPKFRGSSRFVAVGLFGRIIDALFRLSLIVRGSVPGGVTAALHRQYRESAGAQRFPYYAHVSSSGGYLVLQYWFFYAMNDWRSTFSGVNDHEADWEQVTIYLAPSGESSGEDYRVAWIAFSSHDETGDDLRRRYDDPDISWIDGTHPVVNAGAGSHSGAYLAGEYLVHVEPPALRRVFLAVQRVASVLLPWTQRTGAGHVGLPYIDYKRGDGKQIGPGTPNDWTMTLIDANTPWVRDFRGLWGLDTRDPFGGERAPAGPRYERDGTIRPSWSDPVAWAGLDKVPATPEQRAKSITARLHTLDEQIQALSAGIDENDERARQLQAGLTVLPAGPGSSTGAELADCELRLATQRAQRRAATVERELLLAGRGRPQIADPHAHLRRRALPDVAPRRPPGLLLRLWTEVSLAALLVILGLTLILDRTNLWIALAIATVIVSAVEALLRRRLALFLLGAAAIVVLIGTVILLFHNLRSGLGVLCLVAALMVLTANLRSYLARR